MNRTKYRAYDKQAKTMYYDIEEGAIVNKLMVTFAYFLNNERFAVMQCTGLKDSKGKLIYEGDLLRRKQDPRIYEVSWNFYQWTPWHKDCLSSAVDLSNRQVAINFFPLAQGETAEEFTIIEHKYEHVN